ncbi:MAG: hypothetical protein QXG01_00810 [Candidatus Bathyarchaeia archaeon]
MSLLFGYPICMNRICAIKTGAFPTAFLRWVALWCMEIESGHRSKKPIQKL